MKNLLIGTAAGLVLATLGVGAFYEDAGKKQATEAYLEAIFWSLDDEQFRLSENLNGDRVVTITVNGAEDATYRAIWPMNVESPEPQLERYDSEDGWVRVSALPEGCLTYGNGVCTTNPR